MPEHLRTIIHGPDFDASFRRVRAGARRADEALRGIEWLIVRNPTLGHPVRLGSQVHIVSIKEGIPDCPPITLYYAFDDNNIYLLFVELTYNDDTEAPF